MRSLLIVACLSITSLLFSQESIKWGKPTDKEKGLKICSFDSTANAVILSENGSIDFGSGYAYIHVYRKIKILNSNGIQYANIQIPFYHKEDIEKIKDVKAQTINSDNGLITTIELNNDDVYTEIHNSRWSEIRFTFPSAKEGSILEYKYTLVTKRITFLNAWVFQHEIPTIHSEIKAVIPSTLKYSLVFFGDKLLSKYNGKENKENLWALNNIPGYENEKNVFCYEDYIEKLQFQLLSYEAWEGGGYSKGIYDVDVLKNWDKLAEEVLINYNLYLNKSGKAKEILDSIIGSTDTKSDKIQKIYRFVNSNITWDKDYYIFSEKKVGELIGSRRGNSTEMNLLLCSLLNESGIKAYPVLISTKSHGKITKDYPLLEQFNHIIVAIENGNAYEFMDAISSSKNCFLIPYEDFNYYGFLLDNKNSKWIDIANQIDSKEIKTVICQFNNSNVYLTVKNKFSGYYSLIQRSLIKENNAKQSELLNFIVNASFKRDSLIIGSLDNEYTDYVESSFYSSEFKTGDKIYFNLNADDSGNPYKQDERLFPIELDFPFSKQITYFITIPMGYILKVVPKNVALALPNNAGKFIYNIVNSGNQIVIIVKQEIRASILPKEYYPYLKEFYNQIIMKISEPIIVEKEL